MLHLGINITTTRIISEEIAFGNNSGAKKSVINCIIISLLFGIGAGIIFSINSEFIVNICFHGKTGKSIVYLISVAFPMIAVSSCIYGYFTAVRRVYKSVIANFLEYLFKFFITIFLLKKYVNYNNIEIICFVLILGDVLSEICSFIFNIFAFTKDLNKYIDKVKTRKKENFLTRIFRILLPISITSYVKSGLSTVKQLIIPTSLEKNGLECEKALAEYGSISGITLPIIMFPSTILAGIAVLLVPEFSSYYVKKRYEKIKEYTRKLLIYTFIFSTITTIFFIIYGTNIGIIFYKDEEIGKYIKIFSLLIPFIYVDIIVDTILKGLDAQVHVLFINILDLLFTIGFIFLLVPHFGIKGYIVSIFCSEILNFLLSLNKIFKLEKNFN